MTIDIKRYPGGVTGESDLDALGVLVEPQRLRVYEHLLSAAGPVSPSELAHGLGMGRTLLVFHLGKLVEAGFVEALAPATPAGQRGRPPQRYRATRREVTASVPARRYELMADVLLAAAAAGGDLERSARRVARRRGAELAAAEPARRRPRTAAGRLAPVERLLNRLGYAPRREQETVVLANCPFERLRATNPGLVCSINHALAEGYLDGLEFSGDLTATLRPCQDTCCVVVGLA